MFILLGDLAQEIGGTVEAVADPTVEILPAEVTLGMRAASDAASMVTSRETALRTGEVTDTDATPDHLLAEKDATQGTVVKKGEDLPQTEEDRLLTETTKGRDPTAAEAPDLPTLRDAADEKVKQEITLNK